MDIIRNKDKLVFRARMGTTYIPESNTYTVNALKPRDKSVPWVYTTPTTLKLHVECNGDVDIYNMLMSNAPRYASMERGVIVTIVRPKKIITKNLKPEYVEIDRQNREKEELRMKECEAMLKKLAELNIEVTVNNYHRYKTPDEYIESVTESYDYQHAGLAFSCHSGTRFYQVMYHEGIIEKSIPDWYKNGDF